MTITKGALFLAFVAQASAFAAEIKKPEACVDGGAACTAAGGSCCYSPDATHDCCCGSGTHCTVFSGTSCGTSCAPNTGSADAKIAAQFMKAMLSK